MGATLDQICLAGRAARRASKPARPAPSRSQQKWPDRAVQLAWMCGDGPVSNAIHDRAHARHAMQGEQQPPKK